MMKIVQLPGIIESSENKNKGLRVLDYEFKV